MHRALDDVTQLCAAGAENRFEILHHLARLLFDCLADRLACLRVPRHLSRYIQEVTGADRWRIGASGGWRIAADRDGGPACHVILRYEEPLRCRNACGDRRPGSPGTESRSGRRICQAAWTRLAP